MNDQLSNPLRFATLKAWMMRGYCVGLVLLCAGCLKAPEPNVSKKKTNEPKVYQRFETTAEDVVREVGNLGGKVVRNDAGSVRYVVLTDLPVGDDALESIDKLKDVEVLGLNGTRVTNQGMQQLLGLKRLTYLFLNDTAVTDQGLLSLAENPSLRYISMDNTNLSASAIKEFHRLSPGTLVQHTPRKPGYDDFYTSPNERAIAKGRSAEDFLTDDTSDSSLSGNTNKTTRSGGPGNVVLRYRVEPTEE